jgi:hypothetical protein
MKATSATGVTGFILHTIDGYVFRVYEQGTEAFQDYDLHHFDLEVKIVDADAVFYELDSGKKMLDYGPATLGVDHQG